MCIRDSGHAVFGKQTDLLHSVQTRKAFGFVFRYADIAHGVRREHGIVLADGRDFAVTIDCAHSSPRKPANLTLVRTAGDDMMEHVIVGLVCVENGELDAQLLFAEGLEPVINEVPVLDVYKRQVFLLKSCHPAFLADTEHSALCRMIGNLLCIHAQALGVIRIEPVHLAALLQSLLSRFLSSGKNASPCVAVVLHILNGERRIGHFRHFHDFELEKTQRVIIKAVVEDVYKRQILASGQDQAIPEQSTATASSSRYGFTRGAEYYGRGNK